jgi:predicted PhzF superfamily epimerase YddE/YHI9
MTTLHVLRVFVGPDGRGGNPLGVFLDGPAIAADRRLGVARTLGFSETVFVDDAATGLIRIFVPNAEIAFAGHPTVGTAWLVRHVGTPVETLRPPAGDVPVRYDEERTWIRARPEWLPGDMRIVELGSVADVDAHPGQALGQPWLYVWAWEHEDAGRLRSRSFPTNFWIVEDEASGARRS